MLRLLLRTVHRRDHKGLPLLWSVHRLNYRGGNGHHRNRNHLRCPVACSVATQCDHHPRPPVWCRLQRGIEKKHAHRNDAARAQTLVDDNEMQSKAGFKNPRI
ncbi:hypothetical protein RDSD_001009 [Oleidesulfovibrio alaskensis]